MSKSGKKNTSKDKDGKQESETIEIENTGNYLRTLRLGKGLSIKDVAEATRISVSNLNAIEDQNFSSLPANTFTRGLLNIYAGFLGADADAVVRSFMEERGNRVSQKQRSDTRQPRTVLTPKRLAEPSHVSSMTMAGILLLFIIVSFTAYCLYTSWNPFSFLIKESGEVQSIMQGGIPAEQSVPEKPSGEEPVPFTIEEYPLTTTPPQPIDESREEAPLAPDTAGERTAGPVGVQETELSVPLHTVTLRFLKDTSLELTLDGDETITKDFNTGESDSWSARSIILKFSQPASAEILVNDTGIAFPEAENGSYTLQIPQDTAEIYLDE